ncbi:hypothetical protein BASA62_009049 [Batrachochytrium salamandrivorans]|nr:hypothetical protein BASA62_009049 [Batrachochytrium salamandrivorans]
MRSTSIFALVCAAVFGSASGTFLDFDPLTLTLDDSKLASGFSCKLNKKPTAPVTVYFQHPSISFSECSLIFSPENWDVARTLNVTTVPVLAGFIGGGALANIASEITARATFDGLVYSTQSVGNYHLLNTPDFEVQTIIQLCTGPASCNGAVAVRYGATVMIIDVRGPKKDLSAYTMQQVTPNTNGVVYTPPPTGSGSHTIKLPCGSSVTIMTADQLGVPRLDVTLTMASGYQAPGGLCNKLPSQSTKQLNSLFDKSFRQTLPQINVPGTVCKIPANPQPIVVPAPRPVPPTLPEYKLPAPIPAYHLPAPVPAPAPASALLLHLHQPSPSHPAAFRI